MPWRGVFMSGKVGPGVRREIEHLHRVEHPGRAFTADRHEPIARRSRHRAHHAVSATPEAAPTDSRPGRNARPHRGSCRPTTPPSHRVEILAVRHTRKVITRRRQSPRHRSNASRRTPRSPTPTDDSPAHPPQRSCRPRPPPRPPHAHDASAASATHVPFRNTNTRFETTASNVEPCGTQPPITTMSPRYTTAIT